MRALALTATVAGCPATPPSLPGPGLGSGGDDTSEADTGGSAGATTSIGSSGEDTMDATSGSEGTSGALDDGTSDGGDDGPVGSCEPSPQMCAQPSAYDGPGACDPYAQDCPAGEKCMPIDSGAGWDTTACRPLEDDAVKLGDPCTIVGGLGSGSDDCDVGLMCWATAGNASGTCIALCGCGPRAPTCPAQNLLCNPANGGALPICLPICDPLAQNCPPGEGCYPAASTEGFACAPDAAAKGTSPGDECAFVNACSPGQACINARFVEGCNDVACCVALCDVSDPSACAMATMCTSWWDGMPAPAGCSASVGFCGNPD